MEGFFKEETEEFGDFGGAFAFLVEGAEEVGPFVERRSGIEQAGAGEGDVGGVEVTAGAEFFGERSEHGHKRMRRMAAKSKIAPQSRSVMTPRPASVSRKPIRCPPAQAATTLQMLRVE